MSDNVSTAGHAFTNDPQYAAFTGRVVHEYTVRREDKRRGCTIFTTYQVIDIGRSDPVLPADPEATIGYEGPQALGFRPCKHGNTAELIAEVRELLALRPLNCTEIAIATGNGRNRIQKLFVNQPDGFVVVLRGINGNVWGLEGVTYREVIYNGAMGRIVAYLREHGPSTAPAICAVLGIVHDTFTNAKIGNPNVIKCVDRKPTEHSNNRLVQVWALANEQ